MYKKRIKSAMAIALTVSMTVPGALPAGNGTWKMLDSFAAEDDANKATPGNATPSNVTWGSGDSAQKLNILQNFGEDEPTIIASSKPILRARKNKDGKWEVVEVMDKNSARGARVGEEDEEEYAFFKDSDGDGELDVYEDWTKSSEERAADLARQMAEHDVRDLVGMMVINSRGMGINQKDKTKVDSTGLLDEAANVGSSNVEDVFGGQGSGTYGTTDTIKTLRMRHFILRQNPEPEDMAAWINQMNIVAEDTTWGIPVLVDSNSRNENGQMTFGMNDASGVFSTWPGTLGLAAAAKGDGNVDIITQFANIAREEWDASGLKKGYMYMVDTMTDPRWQRTYGTFGEDQDLIAQIAEELVKGFQGGSDGVQTNGVALTMKHFPGGGARENGFDPHYKAGQWNVYQTEDSLEKYHLPGFKAAIDNKVSSIMPYYAKPSELKSSVQHDENGNVMPMQPVGFAFNRYFIQSLLRDQLGHEGYVNSDSGIIGNMCWGVEELDTPERAAFAINAGTDIISDTNDVWSIMEAYNRGEDGDPSTKAYHYYEDSKNTPPYGYTKEQVTLTKEKLIESNERLLKEMFDLGLFENPYRDPDNAKMVVDNQENWDAAYLGHQKSVVMLKNVDSVLPLTEEKLEGKKVYVEYDSTRAFTRAGARVETRVFKNLTALDIRESVAEFEKAIGQAQMIMFPGGFSAGDEPDGSAKFFATAFQNEKIKEAVQKLLDERDGLALGICNGFQALIKLGLLPHGRITGQTEDSPTLTYNTIGRHISKMVYTKVVSDKSPWLAQAKLGGVYCNPASHGEGRFVADSQWIEKLFLNGQAATQYCSPDGEVTMDETWNVNGSYYAIEGILSPDGRVLGKMAHSERRDDGVAINIYGEQDMRIFESGVDYFK